MTAPSGADSQGAADAASDRGAGQATKRQAFTGAIVGVVSAVILLVSAPRFFARPSRS